ncbi:transglutaminase domain-containing protein [Glaciecola sp. SC05]|uniref:transglutaminase domain-containing protein n=1 Tax=Glaciecola sp. SC05 TaxID=1987355 RepID=UPI0035270150
MTFRLSYRSLLTSIALVLITGCQSAGVFEGQHTLVDSEAALHDHVFPAADSFLIESPQSLFTLSDEAKEFVNKATSGKDSEEKQVQSLMRDIFNRSEFDLLYQADANTDANTTFENRAANCLSLTIMTYAMASHAGFNARFQQIDIPEFWTRRSGFALLNGHINLRIVPQYTVSSFSLFRRNLIIDFDPQEGAYKFNANEIDKQRIVAMFYNNKAAELILKGQLNHAYAYLRASLRIDPQYEGAMLNLGLVYRQVGEMAFAEQAYLAAITVNENYLTAWENLAALYEKTQRVEQAQQIHASIQKQRVNNPYYHLMLAEEALENEAFKQSIRHFKDAIEIDDSPHQFYFGLAKAYLNLGDLDSTEDYLRLAKRKAGKARISDDYGEKMSMLARLQREKNPS